MDLGKQEVVIVELDLKKWHDYAHDSSEFSLELNQINFSLGDLVTTILNEYGIIVKIGEHSRHKTDKTEYCHVLIDGHIRCYLPFALIKIKST